MRPRRTLLALALLASALLAVPHGTLGAPTGAKSETIGGVAIAHWVGATPEEANASVERGASATWFFEFTAPPGGNATLVAQVNHTGWTAVTYPTGGFRTGPISANATLASLNFTVQAGSDPTNTALNARVQILEIAADGTERLVEARDVTTQITITGVPAPPPPPAGPNWTLIGGGAAVVVIAGGAYLALRRRQVRAPPRSTAMRQEMLQQAKGAEAEEIREEIQRIEEQKVLSREMQILEAKRADAEKQLDLLRKRHEMGQLTKLQYDRMREKREQDLEKILREIDEMRNSGN